MFLHANGFNARTYRSILAPLADDLRILAPDLRGHGATTLPTDMETRAGWTDVAEDLLAFMGALGLGRVALAGHSMGGTASLLAAAAAPRRARALALFDPVIMPRDRVGTSEAAGSQPSTLFEGAMRRRRTFPSREAALATYRGRGAFATWTEEMLRDYVADGFKDLADGSVELACSPEWEASNYRSSQGHDSWAAFEASRCPIRILRAAADSPGRIEDQAQQVTASGRIRIETVPGTTHFLPMERPELVREVIAEAVAAP